MTAVKTGVKYGTNPSAVAKENWPGYSTSELSAVTGATYRQLDYWARTQVIRPLSDAEGSGSARRWSEENAFAAAAATQLSAMGVRLERLSDTFSSWPAEDGVLILPADGSGKVYADVETAARSMVGSTSPFVLLDLTALAYKVRVALIANRVAS